LSRRWQQSRQYAEYTSACLLSRGLHQWLYGRFEIRAKIDARPGRVYRAVVKQVDALAQPRSWRVPVQYFGVVLELEKTEPRVMKPGQRVQATLILEELENVLTVPREAVFETCGESVAGPVRRLMQYPENTAGALMDPNPPALPSDVSVSAARSYMSKVKSSEVYYLYITNRDGALVGVCGNLEHTGGQRAEIRSNFVGWDQHPRCLKRCPARY